MLNCEESATSAVVLMPGRFAYQRFPPWVPMISIDWQCATGHLFSSLTLLSMITDIETDIPGRNIEPAEVSNSSFVFWELKIS